MLELIYAILIVIGAIALACLIIFLRHRSIARRNAERKAYLRKRMGLREKRNSD